MQQVQMIKKPLTLPPQLLSILPRHLHDAVCRCGAPRAEELRLHRDRLATVSCNRKSYSTGIVLREEEMDEILYRMCGGSLYAFQHSINQGYLALEGGIRVGVCGNAAMEESGLLGVREITGLILRIPNPISVDAGEILSLLKSEQGLHGVLIYAPPGVGKTTLLRAVAKQASSPAYGLRTVVVDSRRELFATLAGQELMLDVLVGYPRELGIEIAVRSMGADMVICDEIGSAADATAILRAANCGVPLVASAHAASVDELLHRPFFRSLHRARVFGSYVGLVRKKEGGLRLCIQKHSEVRHD